MAKTNTPTADKATRNGDVLRAPAEELYAEEIAALIQEDKYERPPGWKMSARAVHTYICGGKAGKREITPKYIGHDRLVEIAISTLVTDRALLLIGEPGTAKIWLSEHLAAAINGDSTKVVQGTAGTTEEQIRYTWNYAMLIAHGPSPSRAGQEPDLPRDGIRHPGPLRGDHALRLGGAGRADLAAVGEADVGAGAGAPRSPPGRGSRSSPRPTRATAASTTCPPPSSGASTWSCCPRRRRWRRKSTSCGSASRELAASLSNCGRSVPAAEAIEKVVTIFRELRQGQTLDGKNKLKTPSGVLSTAEAISVLANSMALAGNFGSGEVTADDLAAGLQGSSSRTRRRTSIVWQEYLIERAQEARRRLAAAVHGLLGA